MAVDFKKTLKHLYTPKTKPSIVNVEKANYIAVRGSGDPNDENSEYKKSINLLYPVAYATGYNRLIDCLYSLFSSLGSPLPLTAI